MSGTALPQLRGQIVAVTGAASGIGSEICRLFSEAGAVVHHGETAEKAYGMFRDLHQRKAA